jgi:phosphoserine phosphatase RsbU/P
LAISVPGLGRALSDLLTASHLVHSGNLAAAINESVRPLGMRLTIYLIDLEQRALRPLGESGRTAGDPVPVEGSLGGEAFMTVRILRSPERSDQLWVPLVDGTERLGVAEMVVPDAGLVEDPQIHQGLSALAGLIGHLIVSKSVYGDLLRRARRSRPMSTEGELLWRNLPPLTFATHDIAVSAVLEPCYEVGGDAFDYALDAEHAHLEIFDAVGHGLGAAVTSVLTLAAVRAARSRGADLTGMARGADEALTHQFTDMRYVTAVLADLDLRTGVLRCLNAGHPAPVLMRDGAAVDQLDRGRRTPLGLPSRQTDLATYQLEPGDRLLLYTDGITEARGPGGAHFGLDRLIGLAERHSVSGLPVPEVLRRLSHAVLDHQHGQLHDDATLMIIEWATAAGPRIVP